MFKLIFPLVPYVDEGFLGFVARSAEENFRPTPWAVLTYVAPRLMAARAFMLSDTDMEPLRHLLSMTPDELERMSYRAADTRHVRLLGHTLPKELVSLIWRKCCPLCLAEAPYHRAVWDFVFMVACPHHNVMLVDRCAECRGPLNWLTSKLTHCVHCGADYRVIDPEPAPDDIEGLKAVVSLLEGKPPPEGLAGMDVGCLLKTIYMLGQCVHDTLLNVAAVKIGRHHPERVLAYLNIGWQACADWPHSFYRHIDWLRQGAADRQDQHERMYRDIGVTAKWILKQDKDPAFRPITGTFSQYVAGDVTLVTKARAVVRARRANPSRSFFLPQEAIRLLGTSMPRLMRLAEERDMFLVKGTGKGFGSRLDPQKVLDIQAEVERYIDGKAARAMLGVNDRTLGQMEDAGLLTVASEPIATTFFKHPLLRAEVQDLLDAVNRLELTELPLPLGKDMITTANLIRRMPMSYDDRNAATVYRAVVEGTLLPAGRLAGSRGFTNLVFTIDAVKKLAVKLRQDVLAVSDIAAKLNVQTKSVRLWVQNDILKSRDKVGRVTRRAKVLNKDFRDFSGRYMLARDVAAQRGLDVKSVNSTLLYSGARPISGPSVDGGEMYLYERSDIDRIIG
ncbi:TniQ family protein [Nitrospirillum viridazoti]|uniref:TniQ domain-containing protein n=1 Tax=Nitrospirillum viridazoti CBAmc TaxID=1441467 RepID=A0A248JYD3_9PROT|nr:TniQ family protein [Nitrospirillum amazonense]ASG23214.1 hypothetical protein Y958_20500 [Nitrospirillum amazonense CBAmc]TWB38972.1 TniQ protein [Nitrospirillum amazonense]